MANRKLLKPTKEETDTDIKQIIESAESEPDILQIQSNPGNFESIVSTGSTLLDLAISGGRVRGGGVPGGILMEIYGPSGGGKTSVLSEMCASALVRGGNVKFLDPEGRLDLEYMRIYGAELVKDDYHMPNTVAEVFKHVWEWQPPEVKQGATNVVATDSLAALSTDLEMGEEDKMGMKRAKDFSAGLRKTCRLIKNSNIILACTNQIRGGSSGEVTPGGFGIPFYASLRIRVGPPIQNKYLKKIRKINDVSHEKIFGIKSICTVKKSTVDDPFRTADIFIVFGLGIDDIRGNLVYNKMVSGANEFVAVDEGYKTIAPAINHIEEKGLESDLREMTIDVWENLQKQLHTPRKPKNRI